MSQATPSAAGASKAARASRTSAPGRIVPRRPSLLSRPRNVAETLPCPNLEAPRAVWAIPGFDLACSVARPKSWPRGLFPPYMFVTAAPVYSAGCLRNLRSGGAPGSRRRPLAA